MGRQHAEKEDIQKFKTRYKKSVKKAVKTKGAKSAKNYFVFHLTETLT